MKVKSMILWSNYISVKLRWSMCVYEDLISFHGSRSKHDRKCMLDFKVGESVCDMFEIMYDTLRK